MRIIFNDKVGNESQATVSNAKQLADLLIRHELLIKHERYDITVNAWFKRLEEGNIVLSPLCKVSMYVLPDLPNKEVNNCPTCGTDLISNKT